MTHSSLLSFFRWIGFLFLYIFGLILCVWALKYYEVGLARAGNRKDIFFVGLALLGAGGMGAILNALNLSLRKFAPALILALPFFVIMNLIVVSSQLDRQRYKVDAKPSHLLSAMAKSSPNKTISKGRYPYYVLRDEFRGRDYVVVKKSPASRPTLISTGGARSVTGFKGDAAELSTLQARAASLSPKEKLLLNSGKSLWVMPGNGEQVYVIPNPQDDEIWYVLPIKSGSKS